VTVHPGLVPGGEPAVAAGAPPAHYAAFFHELDAWTEYWDIYRPATRGHFYFGDGDEPGLLHHLVPRHTVPPLFAAWKRYACAGAATVDGARTAFAVAAADPVVAAAVAEYDRLVCDILARHFGSAADPAARADYLAAMHYFGTDTLPPATERQARVPRDDPRWRTAGRNTIDADMMWFVWALHLEAAQEVGAAADAPARALLLAGVATGCAANFAWRGHRRTRPEYRAGNDAERAGTAVLLRERGLRWALDAAAGTAEVHALYRFREWGVS
jgi:hypothetical protein